MYVPTFGFIGTCGACSCGFGAARCCLQCEQHSTGSADGVCPSAVRLRAFPRKWDLQFTLLVRDSELRWEKSWKYSDVGLSQTRRVNCRSHPGRRRMLRSCSPHAEMRLGVYRALVGCSQPGPGKIKVTKQISRNGAF